MSAPHEAPSPIESPFSDNEHYLLPALSVPVIVLDEEPSSVIAYTLGSQAYELELIELQKRLMVSMYVN